MHKKVNVDFIGIGAAKAGTTWLASALDAHPGVCLSTEKETQFFRKDDRRDVIKGLLRYDGRNIDKYALFFRNCDPGQIKGEFSVHYMVGKNSVRDIQVHFPDVKVLAVLREPVSRFLSHYRYLRYTRNEERRPLEETIHPESEIAVHGMYALNLSNYFEVFPREQIKVLIYEEMIADPRAALQDVFAFLGVDDSFVPHSLIGKRVNETTRVRFRLIMKFLYRVKLLMVRLGIWGFIGGDTERRMRRYIHRVNFKPLDRQEVSDETKDKIRQLYRDDRKKLEALLGRNLTEAWGPISGNHDHLKPYE